MNGALYEDRREGGRRLAEKLGRYAEDPKVIVLGLPRGGVPVAYEVAEALDAPLDIFLVRKLGVPSQSELAMGAIASGGVRVLNQDVISGYGISEQAVEDVAEREREELERRQRTYRGDRPAPHVEGRTVILVDDGLATGASMKAAVDALKARNPARVVVAVPVAPPETCEAFQDEVDEVVCAATPRPFLGVGAWYRVFAQTTDAEVQELLDKYDGASAA